MTTVKIEEGMMMGLRCARPVKGPGCDSFRPSLALLPAGKDTCRIQHVQELGKPHVATCANMSGLVAF